MLLAMGPAVLGVSAAQISALINTQLAARLGDGRISWITYADRLMEFPSALLGVAIGTVLLPSLAKHHSDADARRDYSALLDWGLRLALLLALPAALALWLLAVPLDLDALPVRPLHRRRRAGRRARRCSATASACSALILVKILAPGFYARQNLKTPVKIAFVTVLVTQTLALILMRPLGHAGLTLATSLGACVNAGLLFWFLCRRGIYVPRGGLAACSWRSSSSRSSCSAPCCSWSAGPSVVLARGVAVGEGRRGSRASCAAGARRVLRRRCALLGLPARATSTGATSPRTRRAAGERAEPSRSSALTAVGRARLAVRAARLRAVGVQVQRVLGDLEAALARDLLLPLLDLRVVELLDAAALQADEVVVMRAFVELEDRLAGLEVVADRAGPPARTASARGRRWRARCRALRPAAAGRRPRRSGAAPSTSRTG